MRESLKNLYAALSNMIEMQRFLTLLVGGSGIAWYFLCIVAVGNNWVSDAEPFTSFRAFMSVSITTIGAALATFVGLILGFQVVSRGAAAPAPVQGQPPAPAPAPGEGPAADHLRRIAKATEVSGVQWLVALLYLVSLLVALQMWWRAGDTIDQAIINLGKSFLGLVGGALSVLLNMPARNT